MSETEIQPTTALIFRSRQVMRLLLIGHSIPLLITARVAPYVVSLGQEVDEYVRNYQANQSTIASLVEGSII